MSMFADETTKIVERERRVPGRLDGFLRQISVRQALVCQANLQRNNDDNVVTI